MRSRVSVIVILEQNKINMAEEQRRRNTSRGDDESDSDHQLEYNIASDNLEFVPTFFKMKQIILLRHKEFIKLLKEFNTTLEMFTRDEPHFLEFNIVPQSDSTILWKALIRIKCSKVNNDFFSNFYLYFFF